jgi:hypothetical protein
MQVGNGGPIPLITLPRRPLSPCECVMRLAVSGAPSTRTHSMPRILQPDGRLIPMHVGRTIPHGAALIVTDLLDLDAGPALLEIAEEFPWAPVCVPRADGRAEQAVVAAWKQHAGLRSLIQLTTEDPAQFATALRRALTSQVAPEPKAIADYVLRLRPDPRLHTAIIAECLGHDRPSRSARHSTFRQHYRLTAKHWQGLYLLTQAVSLPGRPDTPDAAAQLGIDTRTLKTWCETLLQADWRRVREGFGWRWIVDQVLRRRKIGERDATFPLHPLDVS